LLFLREEELDARIRAFKTSDPNKVRLTPDQLHLLVEECMRLEDMHQQRCKELQERRYMEREARVRQLENEKVKKEASKAQLSSEASKGAAGRRVGQQKKPSSATAKAKRGKEISQRIPSSKARLITKIPEGVEDAEDTRQF
jgi:hypothetical protein